MCDVDDGGRGRRRRRAEHLRHPEGAARARASTPTSSAGSGLPFRDVDWTDWDDLLRPGAPARSTRSRSRWSASTSTCPTPTCRSPRRCAPAGSPTTPGSRSAGCPPTTARPRRARRAQLAGVDAIVRPRRLRRPRHRGQARRAPVRPRARHPDSRPLPRPAVHGHRVRPRTWPGSTDANSHGVRPDDAAPGHRHDGRPASTSSPASGDMGGTMRLGLYPAKLAEGSLVARPTAQPTSRSGTGTATRSTTPTATGSRRPAWSFSGTSPGRPAGRVRRAAARRAPVLRRHPGAPGVQAPGRPGAHPLFARARRGRDRVRGRPSAPPVDVAESSGRHASDRRRPVGRRGRSRVTDVQHRSARDRSTRADACWDVCGADERRPAAAARRRPRRRRAPRRGRRGRARRRRTGCCSSGSTGTRSASACGSCPPACSTSPARSRPRPRPAELAEEADLTAPALATCWSTLHNSPGLVDEALRRLPGSRPRAVPDGRAARRRGRGGRHAGASGSPLDEAVAAGPGRRDHNPRCGRRAARRRARPRARAGHDACARPTRPGRRGPSHAASDRAPPASRGRHGRRPSRVVGAAP